MRILQAGYELKKLYLKFPLRFIEFFLALPMSIWPPLRFLYHNHFSSHLTLVDFFIDSVLIVFYFFKIYDSVKKHKKFTWKNLMATHGIDLVFAFPWSTFQYFFPFTYVEYVVLVARLAMSVHVLDVKNFLHEMEDMHPVVYRLVPIAVLMPVVIHWVACLWIWLGSGTAGSDPDKVFEYTKALYWSITTLATVGYGDIAAKTIPQMALASITMIIGVGFFGYVLSNVAGLLARMDAARDEYLNTIDRVESFMRYNKIPPALQKKVRAYFRYLWDSRKGYDNRLVLELLPQELRAEVSLAINAEIVEKVPLFRGADSKMLQEIMLELVPIVVIPGEIIFHIGDPGESMFFIQKGQVEIISKEGVPLATLPAGSFFGETALLNSGTRNATARSVDYSDLFYLRREAFDKVLARHPQFEESVRRVAFERLNSTKKKAS